MTKKKERNSDRNNYYRVLIGEIFEELGLELHHFRHIKPTLEKLEWAQDISPDALFLIDAIYQNTLDHIIDKLADAKDMHVEGLAIDGLEKSLRVRRGLCRKADVL